ncbi:MAG: metallophosphoesterase [Fimbriimonadaceae bacterium]|nr:metallophosphoesterase [Fimbriimonadaceae bacterium]
MGRQRWIWLLALPALAHGAVVRGRVGLDVNGDGRLSADEPPLAGVVVSDETSLVRSDAAGRYQLTLAGPATVFVVNPSGTWPSGRWWQPVTAGAAIDFALVRQDQSGPLTFVQGTDMHWNPTASPQYQQYIAALNALPPSVRFVLHTGDLVRDWNGTTADAAQELLTGYQRDTAALRRPLRELPGNHEVWGTANQAVAETSVGFGKALYRGSLGPCCYAFRWGAYHFLCLDATTVDGRQVGYGVTAATVAWLRQYLADVPPGEPLVIAVHEPLGDAAGDQELAGLLTGRRLLLTLCGHWHSRGSSQWGGAPQVVGGATSYAWHGYLPFPPQPFGYVVYRLADTQVEWAYGDWAEPHAIDLQRPGFEATWQATTQVQGQVLDLGGRIRTVTAELAGTRSELTVQRTGALTTSFSGQVASGGAPQGIYDLTLTASDGTASWTETLPVVLTEGPTEPATPGAVEYHGLLRGNLAADDQLDLHGASLAVGSLPTSASGTRLEFRGEAPLGRLRKVVLRVGAGRQASLSELCLLVDGRRVVDPRFPFRLPRTTSGPRNEVVYYLDPTYRGPRGTAP